VGCQRFLHFYFISLTIYYNVVFMTCGKILFKNDLGIKICQFSKDFSISGKKIISAILDAYIGH